MKVLAAISLILQPSVALAQSSASEARPVGVAVAVDGGTVAERASWARRMRSSVRHGALSAGARLCDEKLEIEAASIVDAGTCNEECEAVVGRLFASNRLLFIRLQISESMFVAKLGKLSASGSLAELENAAVILGRAAVSSNSLLLIKDEPTSVWFVDGRPVRVGVHVPVTAGPHIVRRGDGTGLNAVRRIDVLPGETRTIVHSIHVVAENSSRDPLAAPPKSPRSGTHAKWATGAGAVVLLSLGALALTFDDGGERSKRITVIEIGE